ncbi:MAG: glycosyltransferase family 2 protein [Betaproteobacteria bacterium]|nr:glycosyltransferase family 2 protein [Betaproteobacteria bacterium]
MGRQVRRPDPEAGNLLVPVGGDLVLSVVSHGQRSLLLGLLDDLRRNVATPFRLIVTENIPEETVLAPADYPFPVEVIRNLERKGFGANHNAALGRAGNGLFCVLNPDIRIPSDPFHALSAIARDPRVGVAAPAVMSPEGIPEDNARAFPSVFTLLAKALGHRPRTAAPEGMAVYHPDWVAGMFMLMRSDTLRALGGFDENYFLYYEDVDLCARMRDRGLEATVCTSVSVIHAARRESRRNLRYAWWHLCSVTKFLVSRPRIALGLRPDRWKR